MKLTNLEKIDFKLPLVWKIPFYEFIGKKITLKEFEKELYKVPELEFTLGEDLYIELLSFDFTNNHLLNNITSFILEKILTEVNEYDCRLFVLIREFYTTDIRLKIKEAKSLPEAIINIFTGAHITNEEYTDYACDIRFFEKEVMSLNTFAGNCRHILPSHAVVIGYASNTDVQLIMDNDGIVYFYFHIMKVGQVNYGGDFFDALKKILFRLGYGQKLCFAHPIQLSPPKTKK